MKIEHSENINLPLGLGSVLFEVGTEHHQGANDVMITLPFKVEGISKFHSTNGSVWLAQDGSFLFMNDAAVVVRVKLETCEAEYLLSPAGEYFAEFKECDAGYRARLFTESGQSRWIPVEKGDFKPGLGPVLAGRFPSAHP